MTDPKVDVIRYSSFRECPDRHLHTEGPHGYIGWHSWAHAMNKLHYQKRCPTCSYYTIIVPRKKHPEEACDMESCPLRGEDRAFRTNEW